MKIKTILRERKDHFVITIYKDQRKNLKIGDIILIELNGKELVRKIKKDFHITLPKKILKKCSNRNNIEFRILKVIKEPEGLERTKKMFRGGKFDIAFFIPLKTIHKNPIYIIPRKQNEITVWYSVWGGVQPISINRYINNYIELFETIGFLYGDGSIEGVRSIRFTNSDSGTLKHCIKTFSHMGIHKNTWKAQIIYSSNEKISEFEELKIRYSWIKKLNIPKDNVKSVLYSKSKKDNSKNSSARIFIDNAVLYEIFVNGLLKKILPSVLNPKNEIEQNISKAFLRGIFAAESFNYIRNNSIARVSVAFDPHSNEKTIFERILLKNGITNIREHKNHNSIGITSWSNFNKLYEIDVYKLHERKRKEFNNAFINHKFTKNRLYNLS